MSLNKVMLIGRIGSDLELKKTNSDFSFVNFSVATTERFKKDGEWKDSTEWHKVSAFNRLAEICCEYLSKGSLVYIEGKLKTSSWEKEGVKKYKTEIIVSKIDFLSAKNKNEQKENKNQTQENEEYDDFLDF